MKKRIICLVALLMAMLSMINAMATVPSYLNCQELNATYVIQEKSEWCWAASAYNAVKWEMACSKTQKQAVKHIKGSLFNPYPNVMGSIFETAEAANYISNNTLTYVGVNSTKTFNFIQNEIYESHAVIAASGHYTSSGRDGGHCTLVMGWSLFDNIQKIIYFDPNSGNTYACTYTSFCNGAFNGLIYDQTCYLM